MWHRSRRSRPGNCDPVETHTSGVRTGACVSSSDLAPAIGTNFGPPPFGNLSLAAIGAQTGARKLAEFAEYRPGVRSCSAGSSTCRRPPGRDRIPDGRRAHAPTSATRDLPKTHVARLHMAARATAETLGRRPTRLPGDGLVTGQPSASLAAELARLLPPELRAVVGPDRSATLIFGRGGLVAAAVQEHHRRRVRPDHAGARANSSPLPAMSWVRAGKSVGALGQCCPQLGWLWPLEGGTLGTYREHVTYLCVTTRESFLKRLKASRA